MENIPEYLPEELAVKIGNQMAKSLGLKKSTKYSGAWQTDEGSFTDCGLARRMHRFIKTAVREAK